MGLVLYIQAKHALIVQEKILYSPLGRMLIAATDKGICAVQFADCDDDLEHGLKHEFPFALRRRDDAAMHDWKQDLLRQIHGQRLNSALPLDIQATAFQRRVWAHLQSIPVGATRSYGQVAKAIGQPTATGPWPVPARPTQSP